jgi:hypothetical protein
MRHCPVTQAKPERAQNGSRRITYREFIRRALQTEANKFWLASNETTERFSAA